MTDSMTSGVTHGMTKRAGMRSTEHSGAKARRSLVFHRTLERRRLDICTTNPVMPNGKRRMGLSPEASESLDPAARRRVQNRLNQRASRARKRERARGQRKDGASEAVIAEEICVETSATESSAKKTSARKVSKATQTASSDAGETSTIASWVMVPQSNGHATGLDPHDPVASGPSSFADQLLYPELGESSRLQCGFCLTTYRTR